MPDDTKKAAHILIVDDWEINVRLLERILAQAGYTNVHATTDPETVIERCRATRPDLVVLDLLMPRVDGFAILEQLKAETPVGTYRPVLVVTADVTPQARWRALSSGASEFLTKPLDVQEVLRKVDGLLERGRQHHQAPPLVERILLRAVV